MRSLLIIRMEKNICDPDQIASGIVYPELLLGNNGYQVLTADGDDSSTAVLKMLGEADAVILDLPLEEIPDWEKLLSQSRPIPMLWWCSSDTASESAEACETEIAIDGIITPSMRDRELHWALHFAARQCMERQQWISERKQLQSRLEERKWIDMAKGILADMKQISEAEAYDLLRKKAMNERKRMVDVATAIVKAHQLLQS
ncbi:ANTAR domain-containing response regulator [Paenibacillus campi]|uniref:ANTAR domain-containing response regulator n=1 Tax=Paenibacillus campi TaxID=3106031 RepID=UPI002AFFDA6F|nr:MULTISPECIES: ANTAR domain-containing protein [unclassified Paenibacillus]